jgi:hypothetical protein
VVPDLERYPHHSRRGGRDSPGGDGDAGRGAIGRRKTSLERTLNKVIVDCRKGRARRSSAASRAPEPCSTPPGPAFYVKDL